MATVLVVFKILFLVLIAHSSIAASPSASVVAADKSPLEEEAALISSTATADANIEAEAEAETEAARTEQQQHKQQQHNSREPAPVNYAELCYLADGSSSLTLTVNEATPVGSVVGTVEVSLVSTEQLSARKTRRASCDRQLEASLSGSTGPLNYCLRAPANRQATANKRKQGE